MFKLICNESKCANKGIPYYFLKVETNAVCGGCQKEITPIEMTQSEIDLVFDWDYKTKPEIPRA